MKLSWNRSLLVIFKMLKLFVNTLTADDKYYLLNKDNLTEPTEMKLSKKKKLFFNFFLYFSNNDLIFDILDKKMTLIGYVFRKLRTEKNVVRKVSKRLASEDLSTSNMIKGLKHCLNLHSNNFNIYIDQYE